MNCARVSPFSLGKALAITFLLVGGSTSAAFADLNPGDVQFNPAVDPPFTPPFTIGAVPAAYSTPIASTVFPYAYVAGSSNEVYYGSVTSKVFANGSGQLAFSYVFDNLVPPAANSPTTEITRVGINDASNPWSGISIFGVGSDAAGDSTAVPGAFGAWTNGNPFSVQRDLATSGVSIAFNSFGSGTNLTSSTNDVSATIWFTTDATQFRQTDVGLIDGGTVGSGTAYAPVVPEPASVVLAIFGLVACWGLTRRPRCV